LSPFKLKLLPKKLVPRIILFVHLGRMSWDSVPVLDVIITGESYLVVLKWAVMPFQMKWSELLPGHIGVWLMH
jgi:hypothetical protein